MQNHPRELHAAAEPACRTALIAPEIIARALPFLAYMAVMALTDLAALTVARDVRWLYAVKIALVAALLFVFRNSYPELRSAARIQAGQLVLALVLGCAVFVAWINLDFGWLVLGRSVQFNPASTGVLDIPLVTVRIIGATLIVPLMEELFWRSFLMRWLDCRDFTQFDPRAVTRFSFALIAVLFGFEHDLWFAGIVAALAYNFLYVYTRNLWLPILSHAVTNGLLGIWVVYGNHWEFW